MGTKMEVNFYFKNRYGYDIVKLTLTPSCCRPIQNVITFVDATTKKGVTKYIMKIIIIIQEF